MRRADRVPAAGDGAPASERIRFDKWLWAARFYKTRTLAAQAIETGHARVGGERVKPAYPVRAGMRVSVRKHGLVWDVEVEGVADRRGSASAAAALYREAPESVARRDEEVRLRQAAAATRPAFPGRPTKRERRKLEDFLNEP
jgi:ribosome-associated heat shock protein Hsp15